MADSKLSALDAEATIEDEDLWYLVVEPDGTAVSKQVTGTTVKAWLNVSYLALAGGTLTGALREAVVALTDGANIALDASLGNIFTVTLGGNRTLDNPTNPVNGQKIVVRVRQDATGSRTLAYGSAYRFGTDVASPTLTTTAAKTDYLGFIYNGTDSKWDCVAWARGY